MELSKLQWYIVIINIIAFLIYTVDYHIYMHGGDGIKPPVICNLVTICGGALGTLVAEVLWDRKINKINAQSRIYTLCWLMLQFILFWSLWGPNKTTVKERTLTFYHNHIFLCVYYAIINIATFIVFAIDKIKALRNKWRIREIILLGMCLLGGGFGGMLAMDLFNHKVKSLHFMIGVPMMIGAHFLLIAAIAIGAF